MRDILEQIQMAAAANVYYVALFTTLSVPDICGALESSNGKATGAKYISWFDKWVAPKYAFHGGTSLTGEACYSYRCAVLHQGRATHQKLSYARILFVEPGKGVVMHNNVLGDALNIDVRHFCNDVVAGAIEWLAATEATPEYQANWAASMKRYPNGLHPYIVGFPVIA